MAVIWFIVKCILWLLAAVLGLIVFVLLVPITAEVCYEKEQFTAAVRVLFLRFRVYPWPEEKEKTQDGFWQKRKAKVSVKKQKKVAKKQKQQEPPKVTEPLPKPTITNPQQSVEADKQQSISLEEECPQNEKVNQSERLKQTNTQEPIKIQPKRKKTVSESGQRFLKSIDKIKFLVSTAGAVVRRILAGIRIHHIRIVLPVHMSDAAETALTVGYIHAGLHASLGVLNNFFNLQFKQLVVIPDYHNEYEGKEHFSCKITTHLIIMVVIAIWALVRLKQEKVIG